MVYPATLPPRASIAILMAFTIVSVWALLDPWRGSDDQISIVPLSPAPGVVLHAVATIRAAAAKAPSLTRFMHSPPVPSRCPSLTRPRSNPPATARPQSGATPRCPDDSADHAPAAPSRAPLWVVRTRAMVLSGAARRYRARAARRWPPKRCRIIRTGAPIATSAVRDPGTGRQSE